MTAREVLQRIRSHGCAVVRQRGSHVLVRCGRSDGSACVTVVPVHRGDLGRGLLRAIERDLEPCLGKGWLWQ
jgi:predicted RNA binding protein YcfA (HicA-like mRNA interferase family)